MKAHLHLLTAIPVAIVATQAGCAQEEGFPALADRSMAEMNADKWPEALATLDQIIARFGQAEPLRTIGPQFGVIWFRKGLCELKLRKWAEAAKSFETCYRDFPNPPGQSNGNANVFQKRALLKWGEAAMGAGQWETAVNQFRKFLEERDKVTDTYPAGALYVNVAICSYKLGRIPAGNLNLEIAISNKEQFPTPDTGIVAGFEALVGAAITTKNERALLDFIGKNRGGITFEPYEMGTFSSIYMKLGADVFAAEMPAAALAIYQLVPSSESVVDDLRARIASLGPLAEMSEGNELITRKSLETRLAATEADYRGAGAAEIVKLAAAAMIHEKAGNLRGAHAAYGQLVSYFPDAARREDYLFNLIRLGIALGEPMETTAESTSRFIQEFPSSASAPIARQLTLSSLFQSGKYQDALKLASATVGTVKEGTPEHDHCLHVIGGSLHYLGQYGKAKTPLEEHVTKYPGSPNAQAAEYFRAANLAKLREWDEATPLLDAFLAKYPDPRTNPFMPFALHDRATCHFANGELDAALADTVAGKAFPDSAVTEAALALEGNIQRSRGQPEEAKKAYLKALEAAGKRNNRPMAGEVLFELVSMLGERSPKEAAAYADRYWKDFAEASTFRPQMAVAQLKPLTAANRQNEALERLAGIIGELAKTDRAYALENAIKEYAQAYLTRHTPEQLEKHFAEFPGIPPEDQATRALLRMAVISAYERLGSESKELAVQQACNGRIMKLFQELKSSLSPKQLPTPILLQLADHLRENTSAPREALPFYEEAISRNEPTYRFPSLFGRGDTWSRSSSPEEKQKAIDDFTTIHRQSKNRAEREYALFRMVETMVAKGDHAAAVENAHLYNDAKLHFTKFAPEVNLCLARSLRETGKLDEAISAYSKVWSTPDAAVRLTALAIKSWMELLWARNQPGDRNIALESGTRYLDATRPNIPGMSADESALWKEIDQLVRTYGSSPDVK
ncbi:MAG: tetratricopeptide repeat protein [Akkermansiaceae bacterium]|nr:tetratricopeptide repeat protein [Akkermansiaceae bacterium]